MKKTLFVPFDQVDFSKGKGGIEMKLKLCPIHNIMTNHIGNHCLKCIHETDPRLCQCGKMMSLVEGETHSFQCDTPTCVIHKKKLILSIG